MKNSRRRRSTLRQPQPFSISPKSIRENEPPEAASLDRRTFLGGAAVLMTAGVVGVSGLGQGIAIAQEVEPQSDIGPVTGRKRAKQSFNLRTSAAKAELDLPLPDHPTNGDEQLYPNKIGNYSKGLPHNALGEP